MKRSVWSKFVVLALASCVSVVACGDDDDSTGGNTAGKAGSGNEGGDDNAAGHNSSAGNNNIAGTGGNGGSTTAGNSPVGGEGGSGNNTVIGGAAGNAGESAAGNGNEAGAPLGGAAGSDGSGGAGGGGNECLVPATYGDLGSPNASATQQSESTLRLEADLASGQVLVLELYKPAPPFNGTFKTGTFDLDDVQQSYATCGVCATLYEGVVGDTYNTTYFPTGGSVTITSLSPKLTGSINDVPFQSVDINPDTFETVPLDDGCTTSVKLSFDETVQ